MLPLAVQAGVSLIMISGIAWFVKKLDLGNDPRIIDEDQARRLAEEAEAGFDAVDVGLDKAGFGALVRNGEGRMMVIRAHGSQFAARPIDSDVIIRLNREFLILNVPERSFGPVTLRLGKDASVWAARMRDLVPKEGRWRRIDVDFDQPVDGSDSADSADSAEGDGSVDGADPLRAPVRRLRRGLGRLDEANGRRDHDGDSTG